MISEVRFPAMPLLMKNGGFDFCIIDCEHGGFDYSDVAGMLLVSRFCGMRMVIRLPDNSRAAITKFMDMGAGGLLLPMTGRAADVAEVVSFAKYYPEGKRGVSTVRAHTLYDGSGLGEKMKKANKDTVIYAQIETAEGLKNCSEIIAVPGVNGVLLGPNDFSAETGDIENPDPKKVFGAIDTLAACAKKAGKSSGIITSNKDYLDRAKQKGMQILCVGSELSMLISAAKRTVMDIRE